jgi:ribose transport system substrate-binding protein
MNRKKAAAIVLAGVLTAGLTAGCGTDSSGSTSQVSSGQAEGTSISSPNEDAGIASGSGSVSTVSTGLNEDYSQYHVAVILKTLSTEYWKYVSAGVNQAQKDIGCEVDLIGPPSETSYDEQQSEIETTLSRQDMDAVAIAPLQSDMVSTLLKDTELPIIAVDTRIEGTDKVQTFVGTDHETAAHDGAYELCSKIGKDAKVALIEGVQGDATNTARFNGFTSGAEEAGAEIVATQYCDAADDKARNCMDGILSQFPNEGDLDIVFVCNDSCAQAAALAIAETGRTDIKICGYDGISSGVQAIIDGKLAGTVAQNPYNIGYQAVVACCKAANGETFDGDIDTGSKLITKENAEDYLAQLKKYQELVS